MKNIVKRILQNKIIYALLAIGIFLRLYRLEDLMTYLGDEGRDMLIVMDIIQGKNFPLIGPPTSVGKLYLGPIYYYFIAPFAWIFKMSPVGPAVFVAMTGIFSIVLLFWLAKKFFNSPTAYISALFYTLSPLIVMFSRSSWNPNPMPFFCLLMLLSLNYWQITKKEKFLYLSTIFFGIMLQLHYLVFLMLPFLVFLTLAISKTRPGKKSLIFALLIFILLLSPLFAFDLRHNFANSKGFFEIFRTRSQQGFNLLEIFSRSRDRIRQLFALFFGVPERSWQNNLLVISALGFSFFSILKRKKPSNIVIYGWFVWGILMLGLYRESVYPHYLGFLFIFPSLLVGSLLAYLWSHGMVEKIISLCLVVLLSFNLFRLTWEQLSRPPVLNIKMVKNIVQLINKESQGKPFNFCLLAKDNYDDSYRYFFRLWNIPAAYKTEVAKQLFVVCEEANFCQPQGNPKWEIALFDAAYKGNISLAGEWDPDPVIKVFKFVPANEE